ncbi:hypothetical protein AAG570_011422 [Ranatra chinensis]|uniref:Uncharacterized protein n=1 Tax=Ranatra chinensis TaxID=642074 RepID=A0ABD0YKK7_9HEMI
MVVETSRTSSVGSDTGENASGNSFKPLPVIVDILDETHLTDLQNQFAKSTRGRLPKDRLRAILEQYSSDLTYSDEDFDILYFKLNSTEGDGATWELFVDYLLAEYAEKSIAKAGNALLLLAVPIASKPKFLKTYHRHPIIRIAFNAAITKFEVQRLPEWTKGGSDVSLLMLKASPREIRIQRSSGRCLASQDLSGMNSGVVVYRRFEASARFIFRTINDIGPSGSLTPSTHGWLENPVPSIKQAVKVSNQPEVSSTWITDLVCLPDINKVCTSSTERQLRFYHTAKDNFDLRLVVSGKELFVDN